MWNAIGSLRREGKKRERERNRIFFGPISSTAVPRVKLDNCRELISSRAFEKYDSNGIQWNKVPAGEKLYSNEKRTKSTFFQPDCPILISSLRNISFRTSNFNFYSTC